MIFYFSGTGNTLWAAEQIATATGEKLLSIDKLISRNNYDFEVDEEERIGFCFPIHGWRPPILVRQFIKKLSIHNAKRNYCFALCTAGDTIGEAMNIMRSDLARISICLNGVFSLIMPESYIGLPFMDVDTPQDEIRKKMFAYDKLNQFIDVIKQKQNFDNGLDVGRWPKINSRLIGSIFLKYIITDKRFKVNTDKCISCGLCTRICPVNDIEFNAKKMPSWKNNGQCLTCFSCYHHCPTKSIEYGWFTKHKGQYYYERKYSTLFSDSCNIDRKDN